MKTPVGPTKKILILPARRVVFPLESRLTTKLKKYEKKRKKDTWFAWYFSLTHGARKQGYVLSWDRAKTQSCGDLELSVSAQRNVTRAKIFYTLERPFGSARLPRRAGVGRDKTPWISTVRLSHWCGEREASPPRATSRRGAFTPPTSATGGQFGEIRKTYVARCRFARQFLPFFFSFDFAGTIITFDHILTIF